MRYITLLILLSIPAFSFAQSHPNPLRSDIKIKRIMNVRNGCVRMDKDPVSGHIFYLDYKGNIYEIMDMAKGTPYDTMRFNSSSDSVDYPQCIMFDDSTLYVSGNNTPYKPKTTGIIRRGVLQKDGSRKWTNVMITEPYKTGDYYDHLISGMVLSPAKDSITVCSGARGDHGEIQTLYGRYPVTRNEPLTARTFRVPAKSFTYLKNDSTWLANSNYLFASGTRNTFDMAYDANGNLFGVENSDSRDHNEEMNWMRRGKHYGFPYKIGDTYNPAQYKSFDPSKDKLINHYSRTWRLHFWNIDSTFPPAPKNAIYENPIQNIGPDCDKFRDSTGKVHDASDEGKTIGTFTAHRSPLGLVFDNAKVLTPDLRGDAFMLSWTKGYDSCGCTTVPDTDSGPFADPSEDMVHIHLIYDSTLNNYTLSATRIIGGFSNPVDAIIDSNKIFVLEYGTSGTSGLYEITMPVTATAVNENTNILKCTTFPIPANEKINFYYSLESKEKFSLKIFDVNGKEIISDTNISGTVGDNQFSVPTVNFSPGIYYYELKSTTKCAIGKLVLIR